MHQTQTSFRPDQDCGYRISILQLLERRHLRKSLNNAVRYVNLRLIFVQIEANRTKPNKLIHFLQALAMMCFYFDYNLVVSTTR